MTRLSVDVGAGGEGLAEIWDSSTVEEVRGSHTYPVQRRLEVKRDADQAESCGTVLHRQSEENCSKIVMIKYKNKYDDVFFS